MSHLTKEQRYTIFVMKQQGFRNNQIANVIGKDKSVNSRELKRNCDKRNKQYRAELAQRKYERRMKEKPKSIKFTKELCRLVETMLTDNGKEFAGHKDIATALGIDVYFAPPYHSWERGANENMNGLLYFLALL